MCGSSFSRLGGTLSVFKFSSCDLHEKSGSNEMNFFLFLFPGEAKSYRTGLVPEVIS